MATRSLVELLGEVLAFEGTVVLIPRSVQAVGRDTLRLPTTPFEDVREMRLREATDDTLANISDDTEASMIGNEVCED